MAIIYIMLFVAKEDESISPNNTVASKQIQSLSEPYNPNTNNQSPVSTSVHSTKEAFGQATLTATQFLKTAASLFN